MDFYRLILISSKTFLIRVDTYLYLACNAQGSMLKGTVEALFD